MLTRIRRDDEGVALVTTLLALTVVLMLLSGVLSYAVGSQSLSRHDQDWNAALSAAEAGIDDYLYRLNQDGSYWRYGNNVTSPPAAASCVSTGVALPNGTQPVNPAFLGWVSVPGATSDASFRYEVMCRPAQTGNGTIVITATGRVQNVTRSITATLRRRNFLDFLYFTKYETKDPAAYDSGDDLTPSQAASLCARYYYGSPPRDSRCTNITFFSADTIEGPLHTNDAIRISGGPHFNGATTTSYKPASGNRWLCQQSPCSPHFAFAGDPKYATALDVPPGNEELLNETNPALGGTGCLFTGPTAITLNADGTMDVISPFTRVVYCTWPRTPTTDMHNRYTTTRFTLPVEGGVVYVQNVPTSGDNGEPLTCPFSQPAFGGSGGSGILPMRSHPLGFPQKNDITPYDCRDGDAFVQGQLNGRLTIGAQNDVIVVGSATYAGADDLLGLVANNYVKVYHPVSDSGGNETVNEVQTVTLNGWDTPGYEVQTLSLSGFASGDYFRLTFSGQQTARVYQGSASAAAVQAALEGLSNIGPGDVVVTGNEGGPYTFTFGGQYANSNLSQMTVACTNCTGTMGTSRQGGSGDWFTLTFSSQQTAHINYGAASAAAVQTALEALSNISTGDVVVTGSEGGPYTVTFQGQYTNDNVNQMTSSCSGCTSAVATVQQGGDTGSVACDGGFVSSYCDLKNPGLTTSSTTPSLFNGTTPGTSTMTQVTGQYANRTPVIQAALLSVAHSFTVQNPRVGAPFSNPLTVYGAIGQMYRGVVSTFNSDNDVVTGYPKAYSYDDRMKYDSPPKFLNPVKSQWQVVTWAESKAAHTAGGP